MTITLIRSNDKFQFLTRGLTTFEAHVARDEAVAAAAAASASEAAAQSSENQAEDAEAAAEAARDLAVAAAAIFPTGGTTGQGLVKKSAVPYDFEWSSSGVNGMLASAYDPRNIGASPYAVNGSGNLIFNGRLDMGIVGWAAGTPIVNDPANAYKGGKFVMSIPATGSAQSYSNLNTLPVVEGDVVTFAWAAKVSAALTGGSAFAQLLWLDSAGVSLGGASFGNVSNQTSYVEFSGQAVAPANAVTAFVRMYRSSTGGGTVHLGYAFLDKRDPIFNFGTIALAQAANIASSVQSLRVNGKTTRGDGGEGWFTTTNIGSSETFVGADGRTWYRMTARTSSGSLALIQANIASGRKLKFAAFGDSTVDGNNTTGWTGNPTSSGTTPAGNTNHNLEAPNSWPVHLQTLLRAMYTNNSIQVWNAGYAGRRLADGWALANYDIAVTNNPFYGKPDYCFIGFGINDTTPAGSQIDTFEQQMRLLVVKLLRQGTVPILLTANPTWRVTSERDRFEISRQINAAIIALAEELSVPVIDISRASQRWLRRNEDGYRASLVTDALHWGDAGSAFVASAIAKELYGDVVHVTERQSTRIVSHSSEGSPLDIIPGSNEAGQYTGNAVVVNSVTTNAELLDSWIWNECPNAELIYRGIDNEGSTATTLNNGPRVTIYDTTTKISASKYLASAGFPNDSLRRRSDVPYRYGALPYGLSRVRYIAGTGSQVFLGSFEVWPEARGRRHNGLKNFGPAPFFFAGGGVEVQFLPECKDGSNVFGLFGADQVDIFAEVTLPVGAGLVYAHSSGWGSSYPFGSRCYNYLLRDTATALQVYNGLINPSGSNISPVSFGSGTIANADAQTLRINIRRSADTQITGIYDSFASGASPILTITRTLAQEPLLFGGAVGGCLWNHGVTPGGGAATIRSLSVVRS